MLGLTSLMAAAALAAAPADAADHPVQLGQGVQALHGSLTRPAHVSAFAAVLLINGSGPEDRDGGKAQPTRLLAMALAQRGVISLRYDKRGVGESAAAGTATTLDQAVGEGVDWARFLARQPGVRCVVAIGHSEGALIGTLAAHKVRLCGLVLVSGTSQNLGDLIEGQGKLAGRSADANAKVHAIIIALRSGQPVPEVPAGYDGIFGPKAVDYTRSEIGVDPVAELTKVKVPVLVVQGDNDLQASVEDARRLAAAAHVKPVVIEGMNHMLKLAPRQMIGNFMTYANPNLPLAPGVAEAIGDFVTARR
jgi:pimeloyl-ACP methyl ester carboxylesterase